MGGSASSPAAAEQVAAPAPVFTLDEGENIVASLRKLIPLVAAGDTTAQQKAASALANLAVQDEHQVTIVKEGGLLLLVPLMQCPDVEVQRLAAHAIANLVRDLTTWTILQKMTLITSDCGATRHLRIKWP